MSYWPEDGGAWGCQVNAHREAWNGAICADPANWNCGANQRFREDYCDRGDDRCYQVYLFEPAAPWFIVDEKGMKWLVDEDEHALDDQVLFLLTHQFQEPGGSLGNGKHVLAGLYVVDGIEIIPRGHKNLYRIYPKKDGAIQFADLKISPQRYTSLGRPYMRHFDATAVSRMREQLLDAARRQTNIRNDRRIDVLEKLPEYLRTAARANEGRRERKARTWNDQGVGIDSPFSTLKNFKVAPAPTPAPPKPEPVPEPETLYSQPTPTPPGSAEPNTPGPDAGPQRPSSNSVAPLFEIAEIRRQGGVFGEDVVRALWLAGRRPNAMILLRGAPGIGKSRLALEVTEPDRRFVSAVPSTWRGREDLLGYTNPMNGVFQPTPFTEFLKKAERAWDEGDRGPFVVLFEEFNLSPPEYWLSDILVRSQYAPDAMEARQIELGGAAPAHWDEDGRASVRLAPTVRFVGTINSDHTTRDLSPRVLDRVTLVEVELQPEVMIERLDLELHEDQLQAIKDLHHRLESRGAVFSMRTALAVQSALEGMEELGATQWEVLDLVLVTQVLSKVRLFVGEPGDHEVIVELAEAWADDWGANLPLCAGRFERWRELLESGFDVVQA